MDLPNKSVGPPQEAKKKIEQVVSGAVKVKRPATRRFFDFVFAESPKVLVKRIGTDVMWPRFKASLEESGNSFLHGMFWGAAGNRPASTIVPGTVLRGGMGTAYNHISNPTGQMMALQASQQTSSGNYQDLCLPTQQQAETLLANMWELLNQYRRVAVGDLYEAAGITPAISDNAYGWTNLDGARISKIREGYLLELPRPSLI